MSQWISIVTFRWLRRYCEVTIALFCGKSQDDFTFYHLGTCHKQLLWRLYNGIAKWQSQIDFIRKSPGNSKQSSSRGDCSVEWPNKSNNDTNESYYLVTLMTICDGKTYFTLTDCAVRLVPIFYTRCLYNLFLSIPAFWN